MYQINLKIKNKNTMIKKLNKKVYSLHKQLKWNDKNNNYLLNPKNKKISNQIKLKKVKISLKNKKHKLINPNNLVNKRKTNRIYLQIKIKLKIKLKTMF